MGEPIKMKGERRRRIRSKWLLMADVRNIATGRRYTLVTKNLSGTGVCLIGEASFERGQRLELAFDLPDQPASVVASGEVVWMMTSSTEDIERVEVGVKFLGLSPQVSLLLDKACEL